MDLTTIDVESDVRRSYNRRVLFCIRVRAAALLIGLWDLMIHSVILCALIFMFRQTGPFMAIDDVVMARNDSPTHPKTSLIDPLPDQTVDTLTQPKNFFSSNILLNRMMNQSNTTRAPMGLSKHTFIANMDFMSVKWVASLNPQDRCVVFVVVFLATILILLHIYGILTNKPSYIVPYFLIKVFNVIISILSMLGFNAYMPDLTVWLRRQPDFPFKQNLLELDTQTLELVIFTFMLFAIVAKLYIAAIIWYCYGYITALNMARCIGTFTANDSGRPTTGEMYSPPKYEEAIKSNQQQQQPTYSPPPYTPLLHSSM